MIFTIYDMLSPIKNSQQNINIPKISIFMPIYNMEKYIKRSIDSILHQTLKDIEIIAVNDFSNDSSLEILKQLAKNDSRIKIVNNDKNYGLLYSRAIGILNCTGEYLMNLDPDDEFESPKNLEYLYNSIKKSNLDILSFGALFKYNEQTTIKCSNFHKIYRQPKLFKSAFNSTNNLKDFLIWNKIVKKELYLKAYEIFREKIYGEKWNYHEDNIWSILINKYGKSMRCINKIIYIYNDLNDSLMKKRYNELELQNLIYRHKMYKEIFTLKEEEKYLIAEHLEIISFFEESKNFYKIIKDKYLIRKQIMEIFISFYKNYKFSELIKKKLINFLNKIY